MPDALRSVLWYVVPWPGLLLSLLAMWFSRHRGTATDRRWSVRALKASILLGMLPMGVAIPPVHALARCRETSVAPQEAASWLDERLQADFGVKLPAQAIIIHNVAYEVGFWKPPRVKLILMQLPTGRSKSLREQLLKGWSRSPSGLVRAWQRSRLPELRELPERLVPDWWRPQDLPGAVTVDYHTAIASQYEIVFCDTTGDVYIHLVDWEGPRPKQ